MCCRWLRGDEFLRDVEVDVEAKAGEQAGRQTRPGPSIHSRQSKLVAYLADELH